MKKLLTVEDVAEILSVSKSAIYKWTQNGKLSYLKIGDSLRFTKEDIDKFINAGKREKKKKEKVNVSDLLNVHQVSELLSCSESFIYRLIFLQKIPHYKIGRAVKFNKDEIELWIKEK
jgi:excisionase family DNA binding protein